MSVLYHEKMPCPVELIIFETFLQVMEENYNIYEKETGNKMPEQLQPRTIIKKYLENPEISFSTRWRLYAKEDLN